MDLAPHATPSVGDRTAALSTPTPQPGVSMMAEYWNTLARHRVAILLGALAGAVLALLINVGTLPVYRTRTSLDIQSLNNDFLNTRTVATTNNNGGDDTNLQTQIKLLQSETLMQQTSDAMMSQTHVESIERGDLLSRLMRLTHLGGDAPILYRDMLDDATRHVRVKPLGMTRMVEITCESWDREFSQKFCNTLTSTFEQQDLQTRAAEAMKTSAWLTRQVADVKLKAEESQKRLSAAVGGNGLMLSQMTTSIGEDRLHSLQEELVRAQADRMSKEATASIARTAAPETLPEVLDNPAHRAYEIKLADLRNQIAQLVPPLTEQNPKVIHVRSQIREAEAGLLSTQSTSTHRQDNEYEAARHREGLLAVAYRAQQATVSSDLQRSTQVSLLRRELDSEQQLYQTLLQRAKEAGFAAAMQAATIRVVDIAQMPGLPSSPQLGVAIGTGLVLGSLAGIGLAFFRERTLKVFRVPGDVERYLHIHELGVIPATRQVLHTPPKPQRTLSLQIKDASTLIDQGEAVRQTGWDERFSLAAEAYRNATFSILLANQSKRAHTYVVSSPSSGEGKTTVTSNLGVALSKSKLRVVIIDGDLRKPNLHNAFGLDNDFGLRNILRGEFDIRHVPLEILTRRTVLPNLKIISAGQGKEDTVELLHSGHIPTLLNRLSKEFDVILIDTPPALHMADARLLARESDGAILIFRAGVTTRQLAENTRNLFEHDGVRLVGTILNDFDPSREGMGDYYKSYYRYQTHMKSDETVGAKI